MTSVGLGMPALPPPVLSPRRKTRQIKVGSVGVGSDSPISVQSMTTTLTSDINATLQQIAELTATGCDIVRVACPSQDDADALPAIAQKSQIPVIADIHFQPKYVFAAIDAGCAAVRVNPGNIRKFDDQVKEIARAAKDRGTSIRIGVNAGSLDKRIMDKYGKATPEALVESAVWEASLFEEHDFHDFKISVKHNDPVVMVRAYELLAEAGDWPLHLGVTEAGPAFQGTIKSSVAFGHLLSQGIGDTIRVSLSAPPVEEVKVGLQILESLNLKPRRLEIVSCPSCGRAQVDVYKLAEEVTAGLDGLEVPLRVAVMGCVVNGPGEAREADLGVASGNGKGQIFVKGEVIKTVPESQIVETLIEEAMRLAEGDGTGRRLRGHGQRQLSLPWVGSERAEDPRAGQVRVLGPADRDSFVALAEQDPVVNVFADYRARLTNLDERWLGGQVWGRFEDDELVAGCHLGANLVPVQCTPDDVGAFADAALRRRNSVGTIVGPSDVVAALWDLVEPRWAKPREVRARQPHLQMDRLPEMPGDPCRAPHDTRRPRGALPGLRRDVHRGGRRLTGERRGRRRPLPGPDPAADRARLVDGELRRRRASCSRPRSPAPRRTPPRCRASGCDPTAGARGSRWRGWRRSCPTSSGPAWRPSSRSTSTSGTSRRERRTPGSASSRPRPSPP